MRRESSASGNITLRAFLPRVALESQNAIAYDGHVQVDHARVGAENADAISHANVTRRIVVFDRLI